MANTVDFKRGATFSLMFSLPASVEAGLFEGWEPRAQLRRAKNDMPSGLIADLAAFWVDKDLTNKVVVYHNLTEKWPLGSAELDILFKSADGALVRSKTIKVNIERGITK